jgi:hypothetical protein
MSSECNSPIAGSLDGGRCVYRYQIRPRERWAKLKSRRANVHAKHLLIPWQHERKWLMIDFVQ